MTQADESKILSIALDMKVPAQGPVQILEVMAAHKAGCKGYTKLTGKDMARDHIIPSLREAFPNDVVEGIADAESYIPLHAIGAAYGFDLADRQGGILYPARRHSKRRGYYELSRTDLSFAARYPEITVVNNDLQMLMIADNKAAQSYLMKEDARLSQYVVPSFVTTTRYDEEKAERILHYFDRDGLYVIKPVDQSQGNGVRIVEAGQLQSALEDILVRKRKKSDPVFGKDYWKADINPVLLVEPYVASREVDYDGCSYDGTLRVFATMHRMGIGGSWNVRIHDGYWKLPAKPISPHETGTGLSTRKISHSPDCAEKDNLALRLLTLPLRVAFGAKSRWGSAAAWRGEMKSAPMTDGLRDEIFPQVAAFCGALPDVLERKSLYQRTFEHFSSDSRPRQGTGAMILAHKFYYPGNADDTLPLNARAFPDRFRDRLEELCLKDAFGNATEMYMQSLIKSRSERNISPMIEHFLEDEGFIRALNSRSQTRFLNTLFMVMDALQR